MFGFAEAIDNLIKVVFIAGCVFGALAAGLVWLAVHLLA